MKKSLAVVAALSALLAGATASANPIHSTWSQNAPFWFDAPGFPWQNPVSSDATFAWDEGNPYAFANAYITLSSSDVFEIKLVNVTASTLPGVIIGDFDIYQNSTLVCGSCGGSFYNVDDVVGSYFKFYDNTYAYHFSGFITARYDY